MNRPAVFDKAVAEMRAPPHWSNYDGERQPDVWQGARQALQGLLDGGLNLGFEAVDRHANCVVVNSVDQVTRLRAQNPASVALLIQRGNERIFVPVGVG